MRSIADQICIEQANGTLRPTSSSSITTTMEIQVQARFSRWPHAGTTSHTIEPAAEPMPVMRLSLTARV
jgi:hypothetical protein